MGIAKVFGFLKNWELTVLEETVVHKAKGRKKHGTTYRRRPICSSSGMVIF